MSKSRGNVANPDELVAQYGADTVRLFLLFIGPWDQGGRGHPPASRASIDSWPASGTCPALGPGHRIGASPPTRRPCRACRHAASRRDSGSSGTSADDLLAAIESGSRACCASPTRPSPVTADYGELHFNTAISRLMELSNAIADAQSHGASREAIDEVTDTLLLLLAPAAPHVTEEL